MHGAYPNTRSTSSLVDFTDYGASDSQTIGPSCKAVRRNPAARQVLGESLHMEKDREVEKLDHALLFHSSPLIRTRLHTLADGLPYADCPKKWIFNAVVATYTCSTPSAAKILI